VSGRVLPFGLGLLFAAGLVLSGMTNPAKVIAFLDVLGRWDPSLAFVMVGAIGVFALARRVVAGWRRPLVAPRFSNPIPTRIDRRLVVGAAVFGVGWGASGFCPGPALVSLGAGTGAALWFVPAMIAGMLLHDRLARPHISAAGAADEPAAGLVGDG
jgi:uncharacterized membrane protein YedE/YeeE